MPGRNTNWHVIPAAIVVFELFDQALGQAALAAGHAPQAGIQRRN
jgi:hypothetical protein